jgi:hypothetical protein
LLLIRSIWLEAGNCAAAEAPSVSITLYKIVKTMLKLMVTMSFSGQLPSLPIQ